VAVILGGCADFVTIGGVAVVLAGLGFLFRGFGGGLSLDPAAGGGLTGATTTARPLPAIIAVPWSFGFLRAADAVTAATAACRATSADDESGCFFFLPPLEPDTPCERRYSSRGVEVGCVVGTCRQRILAGGPTGWLYHWFLLWRL
jgi:hypothetical protein